MTRHSCARQPAEELVRVERDTGGCADCRASRPHNAYNNKEVGVQQLVYGAILVGAFGLLITERIRKDLVAVLIILALYLTNILSAREALSGFSSEPAIVIVSIFVL